MAEVKAMNGVRAYLQPRPASLHREGILIFASGFLATLAMTTIMYVLPLLGLGQVDLPLWVARLFVAQPVKAAALGLAIHLVLGFGYAWLYADQVEPRLRLRPAAAGLVFGTALWVLAQAMAVPLLGWLGEAQPAPGILAWRLGPGAALASLVAHLAYGGTLGWVYGCHGGPGSTPPRTH